VTAHLDAITRAWLAAGPDADIPRMPDQLARRLLRLEEYEQEHRDQWGNWEFAFCEAYREGRLWEPDVDRWLAQFRTAPLWPDDRPFAICLTHDVDLVAEEVTAKQAARSMRLSLLGPQGAVRFARPAVRAARAARHGIARAPAADALERCVDLEREHDVTATYFFTAYPGADGHRYDCTYDFGDACRFRGEQTTVAGVVRTLHGEGFEAGLHGSYNSALVPGRLAAEKAALEQATGLSATSTRQHFLHWDARITPRLQSEAGFSADSSLGFNRNIGFRAGTSLPFRWAGLDLVQVPMAAHDGALLREDALELGLELARATLRTLLDRVAAVGGLATLVFHPNNLERTDYIDLYRDTIAYGVERDAWFATVRDVDAWLRSRE
jgi:peptidoglycan/xylan/chitin deacetylase (PgdA/CDA1 family)